MRLETLREFVMVAKHLNITKAAQELYLSQPSLSSRMSALEKELGYPLLDRSRNRIALTSAGAVLLDYAQRIIELHDEALEKSQRAARLSPTVKVATIAPSSPHYRMLPEHESMPFSFVDLDLNTAAIDALRQGLIDVAVESDYSIVDALREEGDAIGITYRRIGEDACFLAMMAGNPLARKERLARCDLDGQTAIINSGFHFDRWSKMVQSLLGEDVKLGFRINALDSISNLSFVDLGSSIYICGDKASQELLRQREDVRVFDEVDGRKLTHPVALVCRTGDLQDDESPVRRFVDECLRRVPATEPRRHALSEQGR